MNVGLMQFSNIAIKTKTVVNNQSTKSPNQSTQKVEKFGEVLNQAVTASRNEPSKTVDGTKDSIDLGKLEDLLSANSMEEVIDLLGIPHDDGFLTIDIGEEGQALSLDEMMSLDNLLSVLGIEPTQLTETIEQLTSVKVEEEQTDDLWQLINSVLGDASQDTQIVQQLVAALQGEQKVTPKQAEQLVQFLKLAQVTGKNTDLLTNQLSTLQQVDYMLKNVAKQVNSMSTIQTTQLPENLAGKVSLQGFEQIVQKIVKTTETAENTETTESAKTAQSIVSLTSSLANSPKTISIMLPAEKGAQSEALAKEIQNLLNRSQISNTPGTTKLLLKLYPENLGSIRIEIMQQDGVLSARLLTTTAMGKELLDNQLHQLKNAFANANIQMDRIDITQSLQETDRNLKDQGQFGQQFKQQSGKNDKEQDEPDDESENMSFSDYLINEEV
ncbi:flagellar hook-length control protein FliK [Ureibacillus aquaedulcis]|uniref:Flagellar hook-length control protein FliK n=1 Tax=Ureibacillus aquaedulcis TaxID=3058421 RepID=A0ABT8GTN3_9BACL|nr:flagellar hook-length control protein FliK [Ureibacillus sp. BA0131]MDN4494246.1 flagellar hook-length control protein FliK [Ureibacillus sp. BA0131]